MNIESFLWNATLMDVSIYGIIFMAIVFGVTFLLFILEAR